MDPRAADRRGRAGARLRFWGLFALSIVLLAGSVALLAALLLPGLQSAAAAQTADSAQRFGITGAGDWLGAGGDGADAMSAVGAAATVMPAAGWIVQPHPEGGLLLHSPDRVLEVRLTAVNASDAAEALDVALSEAETATAGREASERNSSGGAENGASGSGAEADADASAGAAESAEAGAETEAGVDTAASTALLTETLASGLEARHVTVGDRFVAVLTTGGGQVLVEAQTEPGTEFAAYRAAVAELLETIA